MLCEYFCVYLTHTHINSNTSHEVSFYLSCLEGGGVITYWYANLGASLMHNFMIDTFCISQHMTIKGKH